MPKKGNGIHSATDLHQIPFREAIGDFFAPSNHACMSEMGYKKDLAAAGSKGGLVESPPLSDHEEGQRPDE